MQDNNYLKNLKEILRQKPDSKLYLSLAYELVRVGKSEEARDILRSGTKHNPFPQAMLALAQLYLDEEMLSEAKKEFLEILKTYPDNEAAKKGRDKTYALLGETYEESELITNEPASAPEDILHEPALEASELHLEVKTDASDSIFREADDFIKNSSYIKAMSIYNRILLENPENKQALQMKNELKGLMNLSGFNKDFFELKLNGLLSGVLKRFESRKKDTVAKRLNIFMDKIRQRFNPAWQI